MVLLKWVFYVWAICAYLVLGVWCAHSAPVGEKHFWKMCVGWPVVLFAVAAVVPVLLLQMAYMEVRQISWTHRRSKP